MASIAATKIGRAAEAKAAGDELATFSRRLSSPSSSALEKTPNFSIEERVTPNSSAFDNSPAFSTLLSTFRFSSFLKTSTSTSSLPSANNPAPNHCFFQAPSYLFTYIYSPGDGQTDDTDAFMEAWEATCNSSSSSPTMHIPSTRTFLIHPLYLRGPCSSPNINVEINGYLVAPDKPSHWRCEQDECDKWIHFMHVDGLSIRGFGTIDGHGENWWHIKHRTRPTAFEISESSNVKISGLSFKNNPRMHVVFANLRWLQVSNITIDAPETSPNTDGIHISGCTDVFVDHCNIRTGDDCISIVGGSSNLNIRNILCGPGHGISIGSLGKHGAHEKVEDVYVSNVLLTGTMNGARIKTWQGGSGYARNIVFDRILSHGSDNPIIIDQFYCDHENCVDHKSGVQVRNITFRKIMGVSKRETAVSIKCSHSVPCKEIYLEDIYLRSSNGRHATCDCSNAYGRANGVQVPSNPCLT